MPLDLNEDDALYTLQATLDASSSTSDGKVVKLPKLDVPTFDGNILNWRAFWEQFCAARIGQLINLCASSSDSSPRMIAARRLSHLQKTLSSISEAITLSDRSTDPCLLRQYGEQLFDIKKELTDVRKGLLPLDLNEDDALYTLQATLDASSSTSDGKVVKLPKQLDVPTFDGNILNW